MRRDSRGWVLHTGHNWRLVPLEGVEISLDIPVDATSRERAQVVLARLRASGRRGGEILLALGSREYVTGKVPLGRIPKGADGRVLTYALEETIPLVADEMTADFIRHEDAALGVAASTGPLRELVETLETEGFSVRAIVPWTLLVLPGLIARAPSANVWLMQTPDGLEVLEIQSGRLSSSTLLENTDLAVRRHLAWLDSVPGQHHSIVSASGAAAVLADVGRESTVCDVDLHELARDAALEILRGTASPVIDLRRDALANLAPYRSIQNLIRAAVVAVALLLVLSTSILEFRSQKYERLASEYQDRQDGLFRQILPGQQIPAGVRSRLVSERDRLRVQSVEGVGGSASATRTLAQLLIGLPTDLRYRIPSLSISGEQASFRADIRGAEDAAKVADKLRALGFDVGSPRTMKTGDVYTADFEAVLPMPRDEGSQP
jgi:hypothetical protein